MTALFAKRSLSHNVDGFIEGGPIRWRERTFYVLFIGGFYGVKGVMQT